MTPDQTAAALPPPVTDIEAAALGAADRRGFAGHDRYIYAAGWAQGYAETLGETTTQLEAIAGGYTLEQEARADAIHAAGHVLAAAVRSGNLVVIQGGDGILGLGAALVELAGEPANWIEHGDPAPATLADHVETAINRVGAARTVVADALGNIRGATGDQPATPASEPPKT